jgi:cob(I)alamin adenosyltransferase
MRRSCVQIYTGDGKGKTTAAMGLALRAVGQGLCVKIVQFLKGRESGEVTTLEKLGVEIRRVSAGSKFLWDMDEAEKAALRRDGQAMLEVIHGWLGEADVLILDEALGALHGGGLLTLDELTDIIEHRGGTEIVMTGRNAPDELISRADLVTEMRPVKHYMDAGVNARKGIEF